MNEQTLLDRLEKENITLANFSKRILAFLIDDAIISCIISVIFYDKFSTNMDLSSIIMILNNFVWSIFLLHFSYHTLFTYMYGASLGKMICKIMILNEEFLDKPNFIQSCIRALVRQLSSMAFMLGFAWAFGNILRKTWQDYLARTIVVNVA